MSFLFVHFVFFPSTVAATIIQLFNDFNPICLPPNNFYSDRPSISLQSGAIYVSSGRPLATHLPIISFNERLFIVWCPHHFPVRFLTFKTRLSWVMAEWFTRENQTDNDVFLSCALRKLPTCCDWLCQLQLRQSQQQFVFENFRKLVKRNAEKRNDAFINVPFLFDILIALTHSHYYYYYFFWLISH